MVEAILKWFWHAGPYYIAAVLMLAAVQALANIAVKRFQRNRQRKWYGYVPRVVIFPVLFLFFYIKSSSIYGPAGLVIGVSIFASIACGIAMLLGGYVGAKVYRRLSNEPNPTSEIIVSAMFAGVSGFLILNGTLVVIGFAMFGLTKW